MPRWGEMLNWTVWRNAAEQMFFSLSVSWGGLITFGSYNKFKNPVHHQALAIRDGWALSEWCTFRICLIAAISKLR